MVIGGDDDGDDVGVRAVVALAHDGVHVVER
jgi:hypothetical protein